MKFCKSDKYKISCLCQLINTKTVQNSQQEVTLDTIDKITLLSLKNTRNVLAFSVHCEMIAPVFYSIQLFSLTFGHHTV